MLSESLLSQEANEGQINLGDLAFVFCSDEEALGYFERKIVQIGDRDKWVEENREKLLERQSQIDKAVKAGLINDGEPETIWQLKVDEAKDGQQRIIAIKRELEGSADLIKKEVAFRLKKYLPPWDAGVATITFKINEEADFCIDGRNITVDLGRLLSRENFLEDVVEGVAHEVFHLWMEEKRQNKNVDLETKPEEVKAQTIFGTVNEGLAVLVSGFSLEAHHEQQGKNYHDYIRESFAAFKKLLEGTEADDLETIQKEGFKNMGYFYVVGNVIAETVLERVGIERFRDLVKDSRDNPMVLLDKYQSFCDEDSTIPKIK